MKPSYQCVVVSCNQQFSAVGIGGLLFLVSDGFLAIRLFQDNWYGIGDLCWITYGIGQMLIVYGTVAGTMNDQHTGAHTS